MQKILEDAGIKLESVVTDVMGKAARRMIEALIAGERDPEVLADMALTRMRPRIPDLRLALVGPVRRPPRGDAQACTCRTSTTSTVGSRPWTPRWNGWSPLSLTSCAGS